MQFGILFIAHQRKASSSEPYSGLAPGSQFSFSAARADSNDLVRSSEAIATANTSRVPQAYASSLPFFQTEFESTKSRSFRFSLAGWFSNNSCARRANHS